MIWRHTSRYAACRKCGGTNLVPVNSPFGRDMIATRPSVAASLVEEKKSENDMMVGAVVLAGIVLLIIIMIWLSSCSSEKQTVRPRATAESDASQFSAPTVPLAKMAAMVSLPHSNKLFNRVEQGTFPK